MSNSADEQAVREQMLRAISDQRVRLQENWLEQLAHEGETSRIDKSTLADICTRLFDQILQMLSDQLPTNSRSLAPSMCELLSSVSTDFVERGFMPSQTATFIFSLKRQLYPLFADRSDMLLALYGVVDAMGLYTMDAFIVRREQIIRRQTQELLDISVPVVPLWEGVLSLPIIGTVDSGRAQAITEKLLFELARTSTRYAVLDISGVPTVDTQTAQYLAKTVTAARLMGAECVITGIRPAIAQVMVALGINLSSIETRFSLADGLRYCFAKQGLVVRPKSG